MYFNGFTSVFRALAILVVLAWGWPSAGSAQVCSQRDFDASEQQVLQAYVAYYGRPADDGGLAYWAGELERSGGHLGVIIQPFGVSAEFNDRYGALGNQRLIENLYRQLFGRDPDGAGLGFYTDALAAGRMNLQTIALDILNGAIGDDALVVANRVAASEYFVSCMEQQRFSYPQIPVAVSLLSAVSSSPDSLTAAQNQIDGLIDAPDNQAPYAGNLSFVADEGIVYVEAQLIGFDPDNDVIRFNLLSPVDGTGYTDAHVASQSGRLYVTLDGSGQPVHLSYNVSDGQLYSEEAGVTIRIVPATGNRGTGAEVVAPAVYASFDIVQPWGNLLGAPGSASTIPRAIDLSASFPTPGDQGRQGSCVGWATAYAIKSYFEKRDIGWDLGRRDHVFSPTFVFNSIAAPGCSGSRPSDALDRLRDVGAATWDKMPYTDQQCSSRPSPDALSQAANFRIRSWGTLRTVADMKAQIANHRPVLLTIMVYPSFYNLGGTDSVYNNFSGERKGGHAVAIVGYDDDRYGGAFKAINSWGTGWGDGGFFWFPYSAVSDARVFMGAYSIDDSANSDVFVDPVDPMPPPTGNLPNLEILSWSADYDPHPGGAGSLRFKIVNSGTATAPYGAYVNLMLSADDRVASDDVVVVYEPIPFDLAPGDSAFRDDSNELRFNFPDNLKPGSYLMALWVDDLDSIAESNEGDNVSFGNSRVQIENTLPDLGINSWYAEWAGGSGTLVYEIINQGSAAAASGWDINLMLTADHQLGNADDIYLAYETTHWDLAPGETVSRDSSNPLSFSVSRVPPGFYLMALWVDDLNRVEESNERNNESWGWEPVSVGSAFASSSAAGLLDGVLGGSISAPPLGGPTHQYNGRHLSETLPANAQMYRVEVLPGSASMRVLGPAQGPMRGTSEVLPSKTTTARNPHLFPVVHATAMPGGK